MCQVRFCPDSAGIMGYCRAHNRETNLRCSQCDDFICPKCSIPAPVGHKCPRCIGKTENHLTRISPLQYMSGGAATATVFVIAYIILNLLHFWIILDILIGIAAGYVAGEVMYRTSGKKLGKKIQSFYGILWLVMVIGLYLFIPSQVLNIGHIIAFFLLLFFGLYKLKL